LLENIFLARASRVAALNLEYMVVEVLVAQPVFGEVDVLAGV